MMEARYCLMILRPSGRISAKASGSLIYLQRLAAQAKPGARQWIELNVEPATVPSVATARRPFQHRVFKAVPIRPQGTPP